MNQQYLCIVFTCLLGSTLVLPALSTPTAVEGRKFVSKPNDVKKQKTEVVNSSDNSNAFSWMNLVTMFLQIVLQAIQPASIDKSDGGLGAQNFVSAILSIILGSEGPIDQRALAKQANELINLVMSLLDTLKTSFTQRSLNARSAGDKDPIADASIAVITLMKGFAQTMKTVDDSCSQLYMCEANRECATDSNETGYLFCQIGNYGASWLLERRTATPLEVFLDAGLKGRSLENCHESFQQCNEV